MAKWIITFNKDGNTAMITTESAEKPGMEQAIELVREEAAKRYEPLEPTNQDEGLEGPAQDLLQRYRVTITGISESSD